MSRHVVDVAFVRPVDGALLLYCIRCAAELRVGLPVDVSEIAGATRDFVRRHRPCQLREAAERLEAEEAQA